MLTTEIADKLNLNNPFKFYVNSVTYDKKKLKIKVILINQC